MDAPEGYQWFSPIENLGGYRLIEEGFDAGAGLYGDDRHCYSLKRAFKVARKLGLDKVRVEYVFVKKGKRYVQECKSS